MSDIRKQSSEERNDQRDKLSKKSSNLHKELTGLQQIIKTLKSEEDKKKIKEIKERIKEIQNELLEIKNELLEIRKQRKDYNLARAEAGEETYKKRENSADRKRRERQARTQTIIENIEEKRRNAILQLEIEKLANAKKINQAETERMAGIEKGTLVQGTASYISPVDEQREENLRRFLASKAYYESNTSKGHGVKRKHKKTKKSNKKRKTHKKRKSAHKKSRKH